jgi:hypothetical protein
MYACKCRGSFRFLLFFMSIAAGGEPDSLSPAASARPTLQVGQAKYRPGHNGVEFSFRFTNPGDEPLYLDCQGLPAPSLRGKTLVLSFGRNSDSTSRPQRIGARQTFEGYRRVDKVEAARAKGAMPGFTLLKAEMAVYPERKEGEGLPFITEREEMIASKAVTVAGKGRAAGPAPAGKGKREP